MIHDKELRDQLVRMLTVRQAHMDFDDAVTNFPAEHVNTQPTNCDYTFWHLLEHMRICQEDIVDYVTSDRYSWPDFPTGLWPAQSATTDWTGWQETIDRFYTDRQRLVDVINNPETDLFAPLPNSGEHRHTLLREINIVSSISPGIRYSRRQRSHFLKRR